MKEIIRYFRNKTIKRQFLFLIVLSISIMLVLSIAITIQARKTILKTSNEYTDLFTSTFVTEISSICRQAEMICAQIQNSPYCLEYLKLTTFQDADKTMISQISQQRASIQDICLTVTDVALINHNVHWSSVYTIKQLNDFYDVMQGVKGIVNLGFHTSIKPIYEDISFLTFGCNLYYDFIEVGTALVSIDLSGLSLDMKEDPNSAINAYFLLTDNAGTVIAFNCDNDIAGSILDSCSEEILSMPVGFDQDASVSFSNSRYTFTIHYLSSADCYLIGAVDISRTTAELRGLHILCWVVVFVTALLLTLLYIVLYKNYVSPIGEFWGVINYIEKEKLRKLKTPLNLEGCQEIHEIGIRFSSLLGSIDELNKKIISTSSKLYEAELQKKISELSYLRSQINPHFLYNTLELMRGIALEHNVPALGNIALYMGKTLRYSIKGDPIVPLQQEIEITLAYLKIQQARFQNRIHIIHNFQEETLQIPILKMLLQPIVENAVFYGLESKDGTGTIFMSSIIADGLLIITIRDDGMGIEPELLDTLQTSLRSELYDTSRHVGLINTNARIRLQYGSDFGLILKSSPDDGTCVEMILPMNYPHNKEQINVSDTSGR